MTDKLVRVGGLTIASDTEIDWEAYMQQVSQYLDGERDYTVIKGATGPLVYPAAHVYIYSILYKLTDGGKNILLAQAIFAWLYLGILTIVMACYRMAGVRISYAAYIGSVDVDWRRLGTSLCLPFAYSL